MNFFTSKYISLALSMCVSNGVCLVSECLYQSVTETNHRSNLYHDINFIDSTDSVLHCKWHSCITAQFTHTTTFYSQLSHHPIPLLCICTSKAAITILSTNR